MPRFSLSVRLLVTYAVVLAVALGVIALALLVILNTQAAPPQETYQRLSAIAQSVTLRDLLGDAGLQILRAPPGRRVELLRESLGAVSETHNVRIMVVNIESQTVLYDSADNLTGDQTLNWKESAYTIPGPIQRGFPARTQAIFGSFNNPDGSEWLFIGVVGTSMLQSQALLFADPYAQRSLQDALADFGSALLLPLCQSALVGLLVAGVLAVFVSRSIARPLKAVADAAQQVAKGNYSERVPVNGPPEVYVVAESFNHMATQVQKAQQAQQDFVANVSHDLKTPLTSIQGFSMAIVDGTASDPKKAANIIHEEAGRLNRLVEHLTDLIRLQSGRLEMRSTALDVGAMAQAIGDRLAIVAQEKGITLHIDAPSMPQVAGDGDRMAQVFTNLISNAINHTPEGGDIYLTTQMVGGGVEFSVRDSGVGIAREELPRIFERFYQIDKARGPERGTGLGLAIVAEIVQAHGGRISVDSPGIGEGTTFTIWLPSPQLSTVLSRRRPA